MKKYAAEAQRDPNCTVIDIAMLTDLQTATQALEVAREAVSYALWQHEGRGTEQHGHWSAKHREALKTINDLLGEK
jgi:hypothetical protein